MYLSARANPQINYSLAHRIQSARVSADATIIEWERERAINKLSRSAALVCSREYLYECSGEKFITYSLKVFAIDASKTGISGCIARWHVPWYIVLRGESHWGLKLCKFMAAHAGTDLHQKSTWPVRSTLGTLCVCVCKLQHIIPDYGACNWTVTWYGGVGFEIAMH
jgi:hypothetical protein